MVEGYPQTKTGMPEWDSELATQGVDPGFPTSNGKSTQSGSWSVLGAFHLLAPIHVDLVGLVEAYGFIASRNLPSSQKSPINEDKSHKKTNPFGNPGSSESVLELQDGSGDVQGIQGFEFLQTGPPKKGIFQ